MYDALLDRLEEHAPDWVIEDGWRDLEWTREPAVPPGRHHDPRGLQACFMNSF
jgi:hypothetical protein